MQHHDRHPNDPPAANLTIRISTGRGRGRTPLSAFDAALRAAGVADFNLIQLSSVIPPGSTVITTTAADQLRGGFGDALYCVYAAGWATEPGTDAWAGLTWSTRRDDSGAGLFVEHHGSSETEVRARLSATVADMDARRGDRFDVAGELLTDVRCEDDPVCAVVIATYRSRGWHEAAPW